MEWIKVEDRLPEHKDSVLIWRGFGDALPAIFYTNQSFNGFWKFTTFYAEYNSTVYEKCKLKAYHEIISVTHWMPLPEPPYQPKQVWQYKRIGEPDIFWKDATQEEYEVGKELTRYNWRQIEK